MSEIPVFESYLSDMAKEGLHFVRRGPTFTYFEAGEPRHMVYRIDVMNTYAHPERLQEFPKR